MMRSSIGCAVVFLLGACNAAPAASSPLPVASAAPPPAMTSAQSAASAPSASSGPASSTPPELAEKSVELPGAKGPVSIDLIAYDHDHGRVWVPVGDTGSVDVFEIGSGALTHVDGFKTAQREMHGQKRTMGPSAVTIGDGVAYVANRATSEVCVVDEKSRKLGKCIKLPTPADFVTYVASTKELWVTTPKDQSITVL
ncbi:MAG: hypothetical protein ABI551_18655, partial [Polyangiaceae bacterium]